MTRAEARASIGRYVIICLLAACVLLPGKASSQTLQTDVTLDRVGLRWTYAVANNEPPDSQNWITSFYLPINAPVAEVSAPSDWTIDTDSRNYVLWFNSEPYPYPNDIPPGERLSGFSFTTLGIPGNVEGLVSSWDHLIDDAGPTGSRQILSPSAVPEPGGAAVTLTALLCACVCLWLGMHVRRAQK